MSSERVHGRAVLVTGGCGFIGSHLVRGLLARGASRVVVVDSLRCGDVANLLAAEGGGATNLLDAEGGGATNLLDAARVRFVRFTLGTDASETLAEALRGVDYVVHLAAEKHQASLHRPRQLLQANVEGTYQLLEAAVAAGVRKVVFSSSLYAYGRMSGPPFREDELPRPTTVYGITKLAGEHLLAHFGAAHGLPHAVLRYFFVYGPRQFAGQGYKSVIVKSSERILSGAGPVIFGDGEQALDYIFVDDVIEATIGALEADVSGEVFNIGSGVTTSVNHLVDTLLTASGRSLPKTHEPPDWTAGTCRVANVAKARALLGFEAKTSLAEGLGQTFRWIEQNARASAPA